MSFPKFVSILLMAVTYTIVELYGFGFRPLLLMWKPFHYCSAQFRHQWGIQTTIMDALVTYFFLSTTKLYSVSLDLLVPTKVYLKNGKVHSWNLYILRSEYQILWKGTLAVCFARYFNHDGLHHFPNMPLVLLPMQDMSQFTAFVSNKGCNIGRINFVDSFQKYYKDGSNGTWDCRWFAGFLILMKSLIYTVFAATQTDMFVVYIYL